MLVFSHAGITLSTAWAISAIIKKRNRSVIEANDRLVNNSNQNPTLNQATTLTTTKSSWITSLITYVDIRLLLIASLLPDIIDKPIGQLILRETFSNGRIFGHTLLFLVVITASGLIQFRFYRKTWLLVLAFGIFTHLLLDQMWLSPSTLLWPIYGVSFPRINLSNWLTNMIDTLLTLPIVVLPELFGVVIVALFLIELIRKNSLFHFLRYGKLKQ